MELLVPSLLLRKVNGATSSDESVADVDGVSVPVC